MYKYKEEGHIMRGCAYPQNDSKPQSSSLIQPIRPIKNHKDEGRHLAIAGAMGSEHYLGQNQNKPPFSPQNASSTSQKPHFLHLDHH